MVDAAFFRKMNPNYFRPAVIDLDDAVDLWEASSFSNYTSPDDGSSDISSDKALSDIVEPAHITEDDFLICCPTVPGFSFSDKLWGKIEALDLQKAL